MEIYGYKVSALQERAALSAMRNGSFTAADINECLKDVGVPEQIRVYDQTRHGSLENLSYRVADRLLSREKRQGAIQYDKKTRSWKMIGEITHIDSEQIQNDCVEILIFAKTYCKKKDLSYDDRHVAGAYSVLVDKNLQETQHANAALDCFHSNVPVENLDDFEFLVINPNTGIPMDQEEDVEDYSLTFRSFNIVKTSDTVPKVWDVTVYIALQNQEEKELGKMTLAAISKKDAKIRALLHLQTEECKIFGSKITFDIAKNKA